jgi:hypothetical protein
VYLAVRLKDIANLSGGLQHHTSFPRRSLPQTARR